MAVSDHLQYVDKQRVRILTVDPATRKVEAIGKDGAVIQIAIWNIDTAFRWPQQNEYWMVKRENGYYFLYGEFENDEERIRIEDLDPGDMKLGGGVGTTIWMDADHLDLNGELTVGGGVPPSFEDGILLYKDGKIEWTNLNVDGGVVDTNLYRWDANILKTDDAFRAAGGFTVDATTIVPAFRSVQPPDSFVLQNTYSSVNPNPTFRVSSDGKIEWGSGGAAVDTSLYRSDVGYLTTDGNFQADNIFATNIVGGVSSGTLGDLNVTGTLTLKSPDGTIKSDNYFGNVSGWIIRNDGFAEFQDVVVDGTIIANGYSILPAEAIIGELVAHQIAFNAILAQHIKADEIVARHIYAGSVTTEKLDAYAVTAAKIQAYTITADQIQTHTLTADQIAVGHWENGVWVGGGITAESMTADAIRAEHIKAGEIVAEALQVRRWENGQWVGGAVTAGTMQADSINATDIIADNMVVANKIAAGAINATDIIADDMIVKYKLAAGSVWTDDLFVDNTINGARILDESFNGVKMIDGSLEAKKIVANSITSDQVSANFLDANITHTSSIYAEGIRGGNLSIGGKAEFTQFDSSSGASLWPWILTGAGKAYALYPLGPAPGTKRYTVTWGQTVRIQIEDEAVIPSGELLRFVYDRSITTNNKVKKIEFHIHSNLPANMRVELVDNQGVLRPAYDAGAHEWYKGSTESPYYTGPDCTADPADHSDWDNPGLENDANPNVGLPTGIGFQIRNVSGGNVTITDPGYYIEIVAVRFEYEKGYGTITVYDAPGNVRSEITAEYIAFNKVDGYPYTRAPSANTTFLADSEGVWVPSDGFQIGSSKITNLAYPFRDLSGSLCINSRFESMRISDPTKPIPSDWTFLQTTNLVTNPSFETNTTGWIDVSNAAVSTFASAARTIAGGSGTKALHHVGTANPAGEYVWAQTYPVIDITPGSSYTLSVVGEIIAGTTTFGCWPYIAWFAAGGAFISGSDGTHQFTTGVKTWTVTDVAPTNADHAIIGLYLGSSTGTGTLEVWWDNIALTETIPDETNFAHIDGVLPQWQSLVSGKVLTMVLQSGWEEHTKLQAISHKRYVEADTDLPQLPFAMSAYFRNPIDDPDLYVKLLLYRSATAVDIQSAADLASDTLLGSITLNGDVISDFTIDNEVAFHKISYSYAQATGAAGDTMKAPADIGSYVYVVLEAGVRAGHVLDSNRQIEWDNIDLAIAEALTPSDSQPIADLGRRITDVQTIFQYMLSGTKAILPEIATGNQGLGLTVVS